MDKRIRKNEICVVGLPRCDYVFSSTRSCFIAYGFDDSPLEKSILRTLLEARQIQPTEAGGSLLPGQNAFCANICSKIITAQFCAVLINNREVDGREVPNANVNMEYGLMLGFNKCVIPFQRASQKLPFNVAGLQTVKYEDRDFEQLAAPAIDKAMEITTQKIPQVFDPDQMIGLFLLLKKTLITPLNVEGDRNIFQLGAPLGFNLLNDFSGLIYIFFGNFTALRPEVVLWRVRMLGDILNGRRTSIATRVKLGIVKGKQSAVLDEFLGRVQIWSLVMTDDDKRAVQEALSRSPLDYATEVYCLDDVRTELERLAGETPP